MNAHLSILTLLGILALVAFYCGRLVHKISLPALLGYMLAGVVLGPSFLGVIPATILEKLSFLVTIGLGFVAFSIGTELPFSSLKRFGFGLALIIFAESLMAFIVVTVVIFMVTGSWPLALLLGAVAPASAPAGTVAVIQEYRAHGPLTQSLYAVVGFDDALAIIIYCFAALVAKQLLVPVSSGDLMALLQPLYEIGTSIGVGCILGFLAGLTLKKERQPKEILILLVAFIFLGTGLALSYHLSFILVNMTAGMVISNTLERMVVSRIHQTFSGIMPLVFLYFFLLAGAHLEIDKLAILGSVGGGYIVARTGGKLFGAWLGGTVGRMELKIRRYLGYGILSQAGVAIGLALITSQEMAILGSQYDLPEITAIGAMVLTTVTATSIIFEIIGPIGAKFALTRAGEIHSDKRGNHAIHSKYGG